MYFKIICLKNLFYCIFRPSQGVHIYFLHADSFPLNQIKGMGRLRRRPWRQASSSRGRDWHWASWLLALLAGRAGWGWWRSSVFVEFEDLYTWLSLFSRVFSGSTSLPLPALETWSNISAFFGKGMDLERALDWKVNSVIFKKPTSGKARQGESRGDLGGFCKCSVSFKWMDGWE